MWRWQINIERFLLCLAEVLDSPGGHYNETNKDLPQTKDSFYFAKQSYTIYIGVQ